MKAEDVRTKTVDQLNEELENLCKEAFNLRFQRVSGQLENTARVRAVLRRSSAQNDNNRQPPKTLVFEGWQLDMARRQLLDPAGIPMPLTSGEFNILAIFCQHPQKVLSRDTLLTDVWGYTYTGGTRTVDVHVRRLRAKLGEEHANLIHTVRSVGYKFGASRWT